MKLVKIEKPVEDLSKIDDLIQTCCSNEWKKKLESSKTTIKYPAKSHIFHAGEKSYEIHMINYGKAKVYSPFDKDKERILRLARDGQILGHRGIGEDFTFSVSALALTEMEVSSIPEVLFQEALKSNALFCYYFMLFFAEELRRSERQIKNMSLMDVEQRIAVAIIMNIDAFGYNQNDKDLLSFTLSRKDYAHLAGTTYETVVRVLSDFNKNEIIKIDGKQLRIINENALRNILIK